MKPYTTDSGDTVPVSPEAGNDPQQWFAEKFAHENVVALGSEQVGFEIRSLQEFMAADHLFRDGDAAASYQLSRIASSAYWRNVFLFAAGRVFADQRNLREHLLGALAQLNEANEQPAARHSLAGSILALDILEDGSANHIPASRDALMRLACRLLDIALPTEHRRLAEIGAKYSEIVLREELHRRLSSDDRIAHFAALICVMALWERTTWAAELGAAFWPKSITDMQQLVMPQPIWDAQLPCLRHIRPFLLGSSPFSEPAVHLALLREQPVDLPKALIKAAELHNRRPGQFLRFEEVDGAALPLAVLFWSIIPEPRTSHVSWEEAPREEMHRDWHALFADSVFISNPSTEQLALAVEYLSKEHSWPLSEQAMGAISWPLALVMSQCKSSEEVPSIAARIRKLEFGDLDGWKRLEKRWSRSWIEVDDITDFVTGNLDSSSEIGGAAVECGCSEEALISFFSNSRIITISDEDGRHTRNENIDRLTRLLCEHFPMWASRVVNAIAYYELPVDLSIDTFLRVAFTAKDRCLPASLQWIESRLLIEDKIPGGAERCDELGLSISKVTLPIRSVHKDDNVELVAGFVNRIAKQLAKIGLWRILSLMRPLPDRTVYSHLPPFMARAADPQSSADVVALRVSGLMWTSASVEDFASEIVRAMELRPDLPLRLAETLDHLAVSDDSVESLVPALLGRIPRDDWENRCILHAALRRLHLRRPSGLSEDDDQKKEFFDP